MTPSPHIAIVYNAYEPRPTATGERLSEESVAEMAKQAQEAVQSLGIATTLVPLQKSLLNFLGRVRELNPDGLINLCEGYFGRPQWESNVAGIFELLGLPFTGSAAKTLAFCQDKFKAKAVLKAAGLPTAPAQLMLTGEEPLELKFPLIVKPNAEDASLGIYPDSVVRDEESLRRQVRRCLDNYKQPVLVEAFIDGREFNVSVMENGSGDRPAGLRDRLLGHAQGHAPHPRLRRQVVRGPSALPEDPAGLPGPDRRRAARDGSRGWPRRPSGPWAAATTPGWTSGWTRRAGRSSSRSIPTPTSASTPATPGRSPRPGSATPSFWGVMIENALKRRVAHDPTDGSAR